MATANLTQEQNRVAQQHGRTKHDAAHQYSTLPTTTLFLLIIVFAAFFLSSCLTSAVPLITNSAVYPIKAGTVVQQYDVAGDNVQPRTKKDGRFVMGTLDIKNGFYVYLTPGAKGADKFRLHRVPNSPFFVVMHQITVTGKYFYALIEKKGDYYVHYSFDGEDFLRYRQSMKERAPERYDKYSARNQWSPSEKNSISVSSLRFLEMILPEMMTDGFHQTSVTAYKVVDKGATQRTAAGGTSSLQVRNRERLEQACRSGRAAACFDLGVMVEKGEGGPQDEAYARALYNQACKHGYSKGCEVERLNAELDNIDAKLKKNEEERKELCGGRICDKTTDGRTIYRTETYNPPRWYFEDGRLAPRSEWPK